MKKIYFGAAFLFLGLTSCSSNDENSVDSENIFMPLNASSAWLYDVSIENQNVGRDSLFISGETTINSNTYNTFSTASTPFGFYTNALNNSSIRKQGDKLLISGTTGFALSELFPIDINLTDFVLFKENSSNNAQLDTKSGTIEQDLQGLPIKIDYNLESFFKESLATFTVPGRESYSNVKVIKLVANLKVNTIYTLPGLNTPVSIGILNSQDVIISTHYYAEGVGMIYSKTEVNYELNDFSQAEIEFPIPQIGSSTIEEFLD
ncbi:hypothetical protein [Flavobacterium tegetincola]|uniref:hypothetical protein n=1 Tax=Flavobacterium tegetincola TaxID=150172 RepID=UPI00040A8045|nr:hypothetical protein [Flavobacterium tegetincola]